MSCLSFEISSAFLAERSAFTLSHGESLSACPSDLALGLYTSPRFHSVPLGVDRPWPASPRTYALLRIVCGLPTLVADVSGCSGDHMPGRLQNSVRPFTEVCQCVSNPLMLSDSPNNLKRVVMIFII